MVSRFIVLWYSLAESEYFIKWVVDSIVLATYAMSSGRTGYTISNNTTIWVLAKAFASPANSLLTLSIHVLSSLSRDA